MEFGIEYSELQAPADGTAIDWLALPAAVDNGASCSQVCTCSILLIACNKTMLGTESAYAGLAHWPSSVCVSVVASGLHPLCMLKAADEHRANSLPDLSLKFTMISSVHDSSFKLCQLNSWHVPPAVSGRLGQCYTSQLNALPFVLCCAALETNIRVGVSI
jgi:hypothetical protein